MKRLGLALVALFLAVAPLGATERIKDITTVQGLRDNQLVGYGLVIGLSGTGDSLRNAPFTEQSMRSMLQRMGVGVEAGTLRARNVAAVVVTATLPPFVAQGSRLDVTVSSMGDASSLAGGMLAMTPLIAADGDAYVVAQGPVMVTGFAAAGQAEAVTQGVPTSGRIPNGGLVEKDNTTDMNGTRTLALQLNNPDFKTAVTVADVINAHARQNYGGTIAEAHDFRSVVIKRPEKMSASRLLADLGDLTVEVDGSARVVVDERTGTIVIGDKVRVKPVAVTQGSITVRVTETPQASQPNPLSDGETLVLPETDVGVAQTGGHVAMLQGPTIDELVRGLNQMGLKPPGIIAILQAIKTAGALQGELVVQ